MHALLERKNPTDQHVVASLHRGKMTVPFRGQTGSLDQSYKVHREACIELAARV